MDCCLAAFAELPQRPPAGWKLFYNYPPTGVGQGKCFLGGSEWAKAYYDQQRKNDKSHPAAVRALANKWIRIIFRCWKDKKPYDEATYMEALKKRKSPL